MTDKASRPTAAASWRVRGRRATWVQISRWSPSLDEWRPILRVRKGRPFSEPRSTQSATRTCRGWARVRYKPDVCRTHPEPSVRTTLNPLPPLDISGPLPDTPVGTATTAIQVISTGERKNKTPVFVTGVADARGLLTSLQSRCQRVLLPK